MFIKSVIFVVMCSLSAWCVAARHVEYPWFVGGVLGYGSTTWEGLVPEQTEQNAVLNLSTPINVQEGGFLWGVAGGVEIVKNFHFQMDYTHYPRAVVHFDPESLYSIDNDNATEFTTDTHLWSMQAKFLVPWEDTKLKLFASGGVAWMSRRDTLLEQDLVSPTFGLGGNYTLTPQTMLELAFSYTAGNGKSELNPAEDFMPFLYGVIVRLFYRLG